MFIGRALASAPRSRGILLTPTSNGTERPIRSIAGYATNGGEISGQFSARGREVYLLRLDWRTIDVVDVESGRLERTVTFDVPLGDRISGFSISPDGKRVLLTLGGDRTDLWMVDAFVRPSTSWRRWFAHWEIPRAPRDAK